MFNPIETANLFYSTSRYASDVIVQVIKSHKAFEVDAESAEFKRNYIVTKIDDIMGQFDPAHQRAILRAKNGKVSAWLTVLTLVRSQFDLSALEFWDALAIRYKKPLRNIPDLCDGCSS